MYPGPGHSVVGVGGGGCTSAGFSGYAGVRGRVDAVTLTTRVSTAIESSFGPSQVKLNVSVKCLLLPQQPWVLSHLLKYYGGGRGER